MATGLAADGRIVVHDPALGREALDPLEVAAFLAPRGWEIWTVPPDSPCRDLRIAPAGPFWGEALDAASEALAHRLGAPEEVGEIRSEVELHARPDESRVLLDGDRVLGVYALRRVSGLGEMLRLQGPGHNAGTESLEAEMGDAETVMGVALAVRPEEQGKGYGRLLRTVPGDLGYAWSAGFHLDALRNLGDWAKVRPAAVRVAEGLWLTAGPVRPLAPLGISREGLERAGTSEFARPRGP